MEKEKVGSKNRWCKHFLSEGSCSLCLGMPPSKDTRDIFDFVGNHLEEFTGTRNDFSFSLDSITWEVDEDMVQENAGSLL